MHEELRDAGLAYAWEQLGRFYSWGGDDPAGYDCSGLVVEYLKSMGIMRRGTDATAQGLRERFPEIPQPRPGCLVFRLSEGRAVHVEIVWKIIGERVLTIGASGGGSRTRTHDDAIRDNAFIKVRPWSTSPTLTRYANPFG
jgi:hypothetical protein